MGQLVGHAPRRMPVLDSYKATVKQLLLGGYNDPQIFNTIRAQGYRGSKTVLGEFGKNPNNKNSTDEPRDRMTPPQLTRLIGKPENRCTEEENRTDPQFETAPTINVWACQVRFTPADRHVPG